MIGVSKRRRKRTGCQTLNLSQCWSVKGEPLAMASTCTVPRDRSSRQRNESGLFTRRIAGNAWRNGHPTSPEMHALVDLELIPRQIQKQNPAEETCRSTASACSSTDPSIAHHVIRRTYLLFLVHDRRKHARLPSHA